MSGDAIVPFLKWAGGKRWLTKKHSELLPRSFKRYIEPFFGGGSVFFHLRPSSGVISDVNGELMHFYQVVRDHPAQLESAMLEHQLKHSREYYYSIRDNEPNDPVERASRFLYLNRACWNGLYRVNRSGKFNVPIGSKNSIVFDTDEFTRASRSLRRVSIRSADFETIIDGAQDDDFVFVDPPYTVNHNRNGFLRYNETIFSWEDQERLFQAVLRASGRGAKVLVTNADHASIRKLYCVADYVSLDRPSVIAASSTKRRGVSEAVFRFNLPAS